MKRYFIKLAYDGTKYHGWQIQKNAHTIQAELNKKLTLLLNQEINVVGCGRTDTGVHAKEYYAHFDVMPVSQTLDQLTYKLNRFLPSDIVVYNLMEVNADLHSRFSALSRTYKYYINTRKNPFNVGKSMLYDGKLDLKAMRLASEYLMLYDDFTSFSKLHTQTKTNICKISSAVWEALDDQLIFTITADRFLRNMVRAIVGTMFEIGKGKIPPEQIKTIIEAKNRKRAGFSVPAEGLYLERITYPNVYLLP